MADDNRSIAGQSKDTAQKDEKHDEKAKSPPPPEAAATTSPSSPSTNSIHSTHSTLSIHGRPGRHLRSASIGSIPDSTPGSVSSARARSRSRSLSLPEDNPLPAMTRRPSSRSLTAREDLGISSPDYSKSPPDLPPRLYVVPIKKVNAVLDLLDDHVEPHHMSPDSLSAEEEAELNAAAVTPPPSVAELTKVKPKQEELQHIRPKSPDVPTESMKVSEQPHSEFKENKPKEACKQKSPEPKPKESVKVLSESKITLTETKNRISKTDAKGLHGETSKKSVSSSDLIQPRDKDFSNKIVRKQACRWLEGSIKDEDMGVENGPGISMYKVPRSVSAGCIARNKPKTLFSTARPCSMKVHNKPSWFLSLQSKTEMQETGGENFDWLERPAFKGPESRRRLCIQPDTKGTSGSTEKVSCSVRLGRRAPSQTGNSGHAMKSPESPKEHYNHVVHPKDSPPLSIIDSISEKVSLEDSWCSLRAFERSHRGRLENDVTSPNGDIGSADRSAAPRKKLYADCRTTMGREDDGTCIFNLDADFTIPVLPEGQQLTVNILSTWGDRHYVGLNGIEIFGYDGKRVGVQEISADPADINVLPEYSHDPRVVTNLVDGVYLTRDDMHLWLAPFTARQNHFVYLKFARPAKIAMIRIWNYNKSRIHSSRGARYVEMTLDGCAIFKGDISKASGETKGSIQSFGDTILFTIDEVILEGISQHDTLFKELADQSSNTVERTRVRPPTADGSKADVGRPFTTAGGRRHKGHSANSDIIYGKTIELQILENWGDPEYVGLTGINILGVNGIPLKVALDMMAVSPITHHNADVARLVDGTNVTTDRHHMWRVPFLSGVTLTISLRERGPITALKVWNYNADLEDSYQGVKLMSISVDGKTVSPAGGVLVRKTSGHRHYDFVQEIKLIQESLLNYAPLAPTILPHGFVFEIQILSTWGDVYYTGLNGLEFRDSDGKEMCLTEHNIAAFPESVNILDNIQKDVRTPDKLVDGVNASDDPCHSWLAPILPHDINKVYIIFDSPTAVSSIRLWNYRKTPARGVRDFRICVDELLVYTGVLTQFEQSSVAYHTVRFRSDDTTSDNGYSWYLD